MTTVI